MQSPFISLLLCSQAAMDGAAVCLETQLTSQTKYFYLDGLLGFLLKRLVKFEMPFWYLQFFHKTNEKILTYLLCKNL